MAIRTVSNTGGNWNATGTWVGGVVPSATLDTVVFTATSGPLTVNVASTCIGINFANYANTITFSNSLTINGPINLGTGGYTQAGANGIVAGATATLTSGGVVWSRLFTFAGISQTFTLADNWTISGNVLLSSTTGAVINGNTLLINANLTHTTTAIYTGTTTFRFNGTGTWSYSSTGIIRNNVTINTAGTLTLGTNIYYNTGTLVYTAGTVVTTGNNLFIAAATTLNTNGITWNNITITGTVALTLGSNLILTGTLILSLNASLSFVLGGNSLITTNANISLGSSSAFTVPSNLTCINLTSAFSGGLNGNQLSITGNLTVNGNNNINQGLFGTTNLVLTGTGTWSSTNLGPVINNLIINTTGTITISGSVYYYGGTLTYTAGTVVTTGSTLFIGSGANATSTTLNTNGITWNNITTFGTSGATTITSTSNLTITNNLSLTSSSSAITLNSNSIFVGGNLTVNLAGNITSGTSTIILNGTSTWSSVSTSALRNNLIINTSGTITLGTNIYYNTGTLTYTSGTVVTTGSTLNIGVATTLNTNGITWNNITATGVMTLGSNLTLTGTLIITGGALSFVLGGNSLISTNANLTLDTSGTLTMPANQTFKRLSTTGSGTINGNTLTITENITIGASSPISGTTAIIYGGTGTWTAGNSASLINNIFTINTAGTLTISGIVYKAGTFTYTAGTIIDTTGTVAAQVGTLNLSGFTFRKLLVNGAITLSSNINATTFGTWGTSLTNFTLGAFSLNFTHLELGNSSITTLPTAWVCQNIEFTNVSAGTLNSNSITINGNILQSGGSVCTGTTTFTYAGTGTWNATSLFSYFSNSFTINTAGTLTIISANIGGGIFTYTAGTVITTGSTLRILAAGTTMNDGIIVWYNVFLQTNVTTFTLNNQLVCSNALTVDNSQVIFAGTDGTFDVYYLNLNSSGTVARNPKLVSTKTYRVRAGFTSQGTLAFPITLSSTIAASQAIFTVDPGATIDVGFVNATDINSSLGRPIYSYRGVFSNTLNWSLLPVDPVIGGGETSYVYVG